MNRPTINVGGNPTEPAPPVSSTPFRMLLVGDFSGRASRGVCEAFAGRRLRSIDRDDLEDVMSQLDVRVQFALGKGERKEIGFNELDDFHPDRLYESVSLFDDLRVLRNRLANPKTFAAAAAGLVGGAPQTTGENAGVDRAPEGTGVSEASDENDLLSATLAATEGQAPPSLGESLIREIVSPYITPAPDPRQAELLDSVDRAVGETLRDLLHQPELQSLEARWRALEFLVRRLETGSALQLWILDASHEELDQDLARFVEDPARSDLYGLVVDPVVGDSGAPPWGLIVALDELRASESGAFVASHLARAGAACGAPVLAGAGADHLGLESLYQAPDYRDWSSAPESEGWEKLRASQEAAFLGLIPQRMLLRLPYGPKTQPTERIQFSEIGDPALPTDFLWGSGAAPVACLIAQAFTAHGWELRGGLGGKLERLPLHVHNVDGESCVTPMAEIEMTERAGEQLAERGMIALFGVRGSDRMGMGALRAVHGGALAARW